MVHSSFAKEVCVAPKTTKQYKFAIKNHIRSVDNQKQKSQHHHVSLSSQMNKTKHLRHILCGTPLP